MRLTVLGSGDAFSGCGCNAGYLIDGKVLVDCGAPAHALARRAETSMSELRLILLTHFHADHSFMLPMVLGACTFGDTTRRGMVIAGPPGTREFTRRLLIDGYGAHILGLIDSELAPEFAVLQDGSDVELAGYRVRAHAVVHSVGPSLAYAVSDSSGATTGFSGDSTLCAGLERAVAVSDVFVSECTGWEGPVPGGHMWRGEVTELMRRHPDTAFVLSHLTQRREVRGALVAHDLLTIEVQARSAAAGATQNAARP